jgi:hypothetical protein
MNEEEAVTIYVGETYDDKPKTLPGFTTYVDNTVNNDLAGVYTVTYTLIKTDPSFETETYFRTVTVLERAPVDLTDYPTPVITLNGDAVVTIESGSSWTDPGATAATTDEPSINVNTVLSLTDATSWSSATPGNYAILYYAVSQYNKIGFAKRTVIVQAPEADSSTTDNTTNTSLEPDTVLEESEDNPDPDSENPQDEPLPSDTSLWTDTSLSFLCGGDTALVPIAPFYMTSSTRPGIIPQKLVEARWSTQIGGYVLFFKPLYSLESSTLGTSPVQVLADGSVSWILDTVHDRETVTYRMEHAPDVKSTVHIDSSDGTISKFFGRWGVHSYLDNPGWNGVIKKVSTPLGGSSGTPMRSPTTFTPVTVENIDTWTNSFNLGDTNADFNNFERALDPAFALDKQYYTFATGHRKGPSEPGDYISLSWAVGMQDRDVSEFCNFTVPAPGQLPLFCDTTYATSSFTGTPPLPGQIPNEFIELNQTHSSGFFNTTTYTYSSHTTESVTYSANSGGTFSITIDSTDNTKNRFTTASGNTYVWNHVSARNTNPPYFVTTSSTLTKELRFEANNWFNSGISC